MGVKSPLVGLFNMVELKGVDLRQLCPLTEAQPGDVSKHRDLRPFQNPPTWIVPRLSAAETQAILRKFSAKRRSQGDSWGTCPNAPESKFQPPLRICSVSSGHLCDFPCQMEENMPEATGKQRLMVAMQEVVLVQSVPSPFSKALVWMSVWFMGPLPVQATLVPSPEYLMRCSQSICCGDWIPQERKTNLYSQRGREGGEIKLHL